jgi:hypothetical protein
VDEATKTILKLSFDFHQENKRQSVSVTAVGQIIVRPSILSLRDYGEYHDLGFDVI